MVTKNLRDASPDGNVISTCILFFAVGQFWNRKDVPVIIIAHCKRKLALSPEVEYIQYTNFRLKYRIFSVMKYDGINIGMARHSPSHFSNIFLLKKYFYK